MSYWGVVIETLTHEDESQRVARRHRQRRRKAKRPAAVPTHAARATSPAVPCDRSASLAGLPR